MNVVCYLDAQHDSSQKLAALVQSFVPQAQVMICHTKEELTRRLLQPTQDVRAAVLLAHDHQQLNFLLSLRELFSDCRIILVLPDRTPSTVAQGHGFRPRLLTYVDTDFIPMVRAVLERIQDGCCPPVNGTHGTSRPSGNPAPPPVS
ncbi:MAG TPA: hypothetical protein DCZ69_18720 [Syntrophobacteraceae bacterium]|jgi:hypothetical protein|nr:hypothetical protein [Syntrophobacteraceae bacterium]HBD10289.1 hypothetical protein [Syntrophobacteraceae bacterium]HBZ56991.1 hypothetical protein [Syntrophobacteraceae bacterium]